MGGLVAVPAMTPAEVLVRGRAKAESRMGATNGASTVTIRRSDPADMVRDATTGTEVPAWAVVATGVPARIASDDTSQRTVERGGVEVTLAGRRVDVPASYAGLFADGDCVDVTAGEWAGSAWRLIETVGKDQATALRMPAEEMQRPAEWG